MQHVAVIIFIPFDHYNQFLENNYIMYNSNLDFFYCAGYSIISMCGLIMLYLFPLPGLPTGLRLNLKIKIISHQGHTYIYCLV